MLYYLGAAVLFVLSQLDYFLLNKVICKGSGQKVDGSFVATILETMTVAMLYLGWKSITEGRSLNHLQRSSAHNSPTESWDDEQYMYRN